MSLLRCQGWTSCLQVPCELLPTVILGENRRAEDIATCAEQHGTHCNKQMIDIRRSSMDVIDLEPFNSTFTLQSKEYIKELIYSSPSASSWGSTCTYLCSWQDLADLLKRRHTSIVWLPPFHMPPHAGAGVPHIVDLSQ